MKFFLILILIFNFSIFSQDSEDSDSVIETSNPQSTNDSDYFLKIKF